MEGQGPEMVTVGDVPNHREGQICTGHRQHRDVTRVQQILCGSHRGV